MANTSPWLYCKREVRASRWEGTGVGMMRKRMRTHVQAEGPGLAKEPQSRNVCLSTWMVKRGTGAGGKAGGCGRAVFSTKTEANPCLEGEKEEIPVLFRGSGDTGKGGCLCRKAAGVEWERMTLQWRKSEPGWGFHSE